MPRSTASTARWSAVEAWPVQSGGRNIVSSKAKMVSIVFRDDQAGVDATDEGRPAACGRARHRAKDRRNDIDTVVQIA